MYVHKVHKLFFVCLFVFGRGCPKGSWVVIYKDNTMKKKLGVHYLRYFVKSSESFVVALGFEFTID